MGAFYLGEKMPLLIANPQDPALDQHLAPALVQLLDADDARVQLQDVVYIYQRVVLAVLTPENDGATASNLHLRAILKLHLPRHVAVELSEIRLGAGHVVAGARVQVRPLLYLAAHSSKMDLGAWLYDAFPCSATATSSGFSSASMSCSAQNVAISRVGSSSSTYAR